MPNKSFKQFVKNKQYTKLAIFDFDGTLAMVPERPAAHEPQHGWNGKDWWGSHQSLSPPFYNGEMNEEVVEAFKKAKADPSTRSVLMTGRRGYISHAVRNVLQNNNLIGKRIIPPSNAKALEKHQDFHPQEDHPESHEEYYCGDHNYEDDYPKTHKNKPDGSTLSFKIYIVTNKLMNENIEEIDTWDDRDDHAPHWIKLGVDLLKRYPNLKRYTFHRVVPGGSVIHIPVTTKSVW